MIEAVYGVRICLVAEVLDKCGRNEIDQVGRSKTRIPAAKSLNADWSELKVLFQLWSASQLVANRLLVALEEAAER